MLKVFNFFNNQASAGFVRPCDVEDVSRFYNAGFGNVSFTVDYMLEREYFGN